RLLAEPGSASSASSRPRIGSSDASAAAGSAMTVTSNMASSSHRQLYLSRAIALSVEEQRQDRCLSSRARDRAALEPCASHHPRSHGGGRALLALWRGDGVASRDAPVPALPLQDRLLRGHHGGVLAAGSLASVAWPTSSALSRSALRGPTSGDAGARRGSGCCATSPTASRPAPTTWCASPIRCGATGSARLLPVYRRVCSSQRRTTIGSAS